MLRRKQTPTSPLTYIAAASEFQGNLHVEGNLRVDGIIHGTVEVLGTMEVTATGLVEGPEIRAHNLVVHGVVKARVTLTGELLLSGTARLEGDVVANALDIAPGAMYVGYIETKDAAKVTLPAAAAVPGLAPSKDE
ncbi:MAG: polymer-forming cytoskeletal protein [Cyanobacteria bacterium]|nr:polymer-forming cytoskeletal protein [Cyanobacteriota bacterium]MDW8199602.1 polymer-forming cytoskeletal protein [Cyanobacteriota bacterium SKYGB_h_bin112]